MNLNLKSVSSNLTDILKAVEPFVDVMAPEIGAALHLAEKIGQGVMAAEPSATALYKQITSGTDATPEQLKQYASDYEDAYQELKADIEKRLATTPV